MPAKKKKSDETVDFYKEIKEEALKAFEEKNKEQIYLAKKTIMEKGKKGVFKYKLASVTLAEYFGVKYGFKVFRDYVSYI